MFKFKHDINKVIEACAEKLHEDMKFNIFQIIRKFEIFLMDFFENTPDVPPEEFNDWYYLRDKDSHAALIFNYVTKEIEFIEPTKYWIGGAFDQFQKTEEELDKEKEVWENTILKIKKKVVYKKIKPLIKWYFDCPYPFIRELSPIDFIRNVLEKYPNDFEFDKSTNIEEMIRLLFSAYHHDEKNDMEN